MVTTDHTPAVANNEAVAITIKSEEDFLGRARRTFVVLQQFHHIFGTSDPSGLLLKNSLEELMNTMARSSLVFHCQRAE
jgi:hypothetical protein